MVAAKPLSRYEGEGGFLLAGGYLVANARSKWMATCFEHLRPQLVSISTTSDLASSPLPVGTPLEHINENAIHISF